METGMEIGSSEDEIFENDLGLNQPEGGTEDMETENNLVGVSNLFFEVSSPSHETSNSKENKYRSEAESEFFNGISDDYFNDLDEPVRDIQTNLKSASTINNQVKNKCESDTDSDVKFGLFDDSSDDDDTSYLFSSVKPTPGSINTKVSNARSQYEESKPKLDKHREMSCQNTSAKVPGTDINTGIMGLNLDKDAKQEHTGPTPDDDNFCCICMDEHTNPKTLTKCSHSFCTDCIDEHFKIKPTCPVCFVAYGVITGNQPEGYMNDYISTKTKLPGYEGYGTIVISYGFGDGIQTSEHPNPGQQYHGTSRTAYLPNNAEGQKVLKLLKAAFKRRLTFTVGHSRTTGCDNVVTWNDIHHKTSTHGGQQSFGYPDATYLQRVQEELAALGVTEESLKENV